MLQMWLIVFSLYGSVLIVLCSVGFGLGSAVEQEIDESGQVGDIDAGILVHICISDVEWVGIAVQHVVDEHCHISNVHDSVIVCIPREHDGLWNNDFKLECEAIGIEGKRILATIACKIVRIVVIALGGGIGRACGDGCGCRGTVTVGAVEGGGVTSSVAAGLAQASSNSSPKMPMNLP